MNDSRSMCFVQGVGNLRSVLQHLLQGQRSFLQPLRECFSFDTLHHQIVDPTLMAYVVEHADVGMIQLGDGLGFALEALSADPIRKERFEREAKTISKLNHPHICVLYDIGHQGGIDYLVMECVEGETLAKRLEKGPLSLEQVLKYGAQIADALDKAHRAGIVHRDLKPGNIMLTATGAKLLDFGLAKPAVPLVSEATLTAAVTQTTPVTREGTIVGTFQYMSPEQVEGKEVDGRSDIFSLGAVLYEMVTGKKAFEGRSQLSVASAILEKEPARITSIKPMTPPALDHAIRLCMAKDPEERWQTARDLAFELKWIAESSAQAGAFPSAGQEMITHQWLAWSVAALLGVTAALFAILYWGRRPPVTEPVRFELP